MCFTTLQMRKVEFSLKALPLRRLSCTAERYSRSGAPGPAYMNRAFLVLIIYSKEDTSSEVREPGLSSLVGDA